MLHLIDIKDEIILKVSSVCWRVGGNLLRNISMLSSCWPFYDQYRYHLEVQLPILLVINTCWTTQWRYRVLFFNCSSPFSAPKWKKTCSANEEFFFTLKIPWKKCPGWLQLVFHFDTENREEQLKKASCISNRNDRPPRVNLGIGNPTGI